MKRGFITRNIPAAFDRRWLPKALLASPFAFAAAFGAPQAFAAPIATGTVLVSTGSGIVTEFTQTGSIITHIDTGTGAGIFTAGSIFDSAGNFYVSDFNAQQVTKFDPTGFLVGPFGSGYDSDPESIVLDTAGNFYVGQADGAHTVLKFDPTGSLLDTFAPATENRGTDWIELDADQCTLYYTSEGVSVKRFNVCTNAQLLDFNLAPLPGTVAFALRLLPAGGMLVADGDRVVRLDAGGNLIQTYTFPGISELLALNLDPDKTSFWTADDGSSGLVFKVDIASGTILHQFSAAGAPGFVGAFGLSVKGEIPVSNPQTCSSTDAALANITMPVSGTLDYGISSPTRTLSAITLVASGNIGSFTLPTIAGDGHSATGGVFVKADPTLKATFELQTNFSSPAFACLIDPIITTLRINTRHEATQAFHMIAKSEHFIYVENGSPGLNSLRIDVNGKFFRTVSLQSGGSVHIDASAFMTLKNNTLTFNGKGITGSFANIEVSDSAPASRGRASPSQSKKGTSVHDKGIWGRLMYEK